MNASLNENENYLLSEETISVDDRVISFPKNEEAINFSNNIIREMLPLDSDGELACVLQEEHGLKMLKVLEKATKKIKSKIRNNNFISSYNLIYGLIFAMSYEDYWSQINIIDVNKMCKNICSILNKILNYFLNINFLNFSRTQKIEMLEFIKECKKFSLILTDEGIKTFKFNSEEILKILTLDLMKNYDNNFNSFKSNIMPSNNQLNFTENDKTCNFKNSRDVDSIPETDNLKNSINQSNLIFPFTSLSENLFDNPYIKLSNIISSCFTNQNSDTKNESNLFD